MDDPAPPAATPRRRDFPPVEREPFQRRTSPSEPIMESEEDAEPQSSAFPEPLFLSRLARLHI